MGTSVESRVPFLDVDLVRLVNRMSSREKVRGFTEKAVLRRACDGLLPPDILRRRKFPFALPLSSWLGSSNALTDLLEGLERGELVRGGLAESRQVADLVRQTRHGGGTHSDLLFYLLNLELWWRVFIAKSVTPDLSQLPAWGGSSWAAQRAEAAPVVGSVLT
jgi:asparagine synthase (glutamine-hydrolysing)